MGTLAQTTLSLDEWVKRMDKDSTRTIIEIVADNNRALSSMRVAPGNEADGNTTVVRDTMPSGTWTSANEGVPSERSTTQELWDAAGTLETFSIINKRYVHRAPDRKAARMQEEAAFVIGLGQEVEDTVFTGDRATNPKEFTGLQQRYNSITTGDNFDQVVDGGSGSTSVATSIWLASWGDRKCSLFFGKNHTGGLQVDDLGLDKVQMSASSANHIMAYSTHYEWNVGLKIENYQSVSRVANIKTTAFPASVAELMIDAYYNIPTDLMDGNARWYCNRTVAAQLHKESRTGDTRLTIENWDGKPILHFLGVPVLQTDRITNAESNIS